MASEAEAGGSIPEEPLTSMKRNIILISAGCIAALSVLVCFWCWFLKHEPGTDEKSLEGYHGAKVVKFHGDFPYTSIDIIKRTNVLVEKDMVGSGGFGTVYRLAMDDGNVFAVKKIGATMGLVSNAVLERELKILGSFKHRNLVNLRSYCITSSAKLLIYDYLPRGNLAQSLHKRELQQLSTWAARMKIATGAARGLAHLHHKCFPPIVHSDIKSSNILLDENLDAHLSDFGLAKLLENNSSTVVAGTFGYLAPEYMDSGRGTEKGDVYSFGVVLLELLSGRRPTDSSLLTSEGLNLVTWVTLRMKEKKQCEIFDSKVLNGAPKEQLEAVLKVAVMCINPVAEKRPTMDVVVKLLEANSCDSITNSSYRSPHSVQEARGR